MIARAGVPCSAAEAARRAASAQRKSVSIRVRTSVGALARASSTLAPARSSDPRSSSSAARSPLVEPSETIRTSINVPASHVSPDRGACLLGARRQADRPRSRRGAADALWPQRLETRRAIQLHGPQRRGATHVEERAVALLDSGDGGVLATPSERPDNAEAGGDAGDLRGEETEAAGENGGENERPQAVDERGAGMVLGQGGGGLRPCEQARDRRAGLGTAPEAQADERSKHPPAHRYRYEQRVRFPVSSQHGDGCPRS